MNFDWKFYIEKYDDLKKAGITSEEQAYQHWIEYGQQEGRQGYPSIERKLNILYLVNRSYFKRKMSRVRFHGCQALSKISNFKYWGVGWEGYQKELTVQKNIDQLGQPFDIVFAYKPLELKSFKDIKLPKAIRYNEMHDTNWTLQEIKESGSQLVVCHHKNDYDRYLKMNLRGVTLVYVGHCAEKTIFKNYNLPYKYDIMVAGKISKIYPLRNRLLGLLPKLKKKYKCYQHPHPGYNHSDAYTNKYLIQMAKAINQSKIVLSDSGRPRNRFGKYVEIPMCGTSALCADVPLDDADDYSYLIEVSNEMSDQEMIDKISYYLDHEGERQKKVSQGLEFSQRYTQEDYAGRLLTAINSFLECQA